MLSSLAGLMLRHGAAVGLYLETNVDERLVLNELARRNGVTFEYLDGKTAWQIAKSLFSFANVTTFALFDGVRHP